MKLIIGNSYIILEEFDAEMLGKIDDYTSFYVTGYKFSKFYKQGFWDGKEHLMKYDSKNKVVTIYTGMLWDVIKVIKVFGKACKIIDQREKPEFNSEIPIHTKLDKRNYQNQAVEITEKYSRGIMKLPPRSGKTVIAGKIAAKKGVKTLFLGNSIELINQTIELYNLMFGNENVIDIKTFRNNYEYYSNRDFFVLVASIQSISRIYKNKKLWNFFKDIFDLTFFDECHHLEGREWRKPIIELDSYYKYGLSATAFISRKKEMERSAIWLKAVTGEIIYERTIREMIDEGWILKPEIHMIDFKNKNMDGLYPYSKAYSTGIVENEVRNKLIAKIAKKKVSEGHIVLISTTQKKHSFLIKKELETSIIDLKIQIIHGETDKNKRKKIFEDVKSGKINILMGTIFKEAVDIPEIGILIVACGGKSEKATLQRFRNMTKKEGIEKPCETYDFIDSTNRFLKDHTKNRFNTYKKNFGKDCLKIDKM